MKMNIRLSGRRLGGKSISSSLKTTFGTLSGFVFAASALVPGASAQTVIPAGSGNFNAGTPGSYILNVGDTRTRDNNNEVITLGSATIGTYTLTIDGTVSHTDSTTSGDRRGIRTANSANSYFINIGENGSVRALGNDAIQVRGGGLTLNNLGEITTNSGQGIQVSSGPGGTITNGSLTNSTALIQSAGEGLVIETGSVTLDNFGIIRSTGNRGYDTANSNLGTLTITNRAGAVIESSVNDAIRVRGGTTVNLTNSGVIYSGPNRLADPVAALASGQALDFTEAGGGAVINNAGGLIRADGHDAVRLGNNMTLTNYGTILGNGVVNDSPANNVFNDPPGSFDEAYSAADGLSFEEGSGSTLHNHGLISGSRHGVEAAEGATGVTITNHATGEIIGRNGSGIGFDSVSADPANVVIHNYGLIRGDYAGAGNIIDRTGNASPTDDGDGDGIDVDGAVTIHNHAGGRILSTGAAGFDNPADPSDPESTAITGGRANSSEAVAIGGGIINNEGLIRGADRGILVNNDRNLNRSAAIATTLTNSGTIEGQNGFAIRFEGSFADTITNTGTIIGKGSIPDPSGTVFRQDGEIDPANGTLDGTVYGAGSARFIRGDGSAIQTGEGNDTLNNSGIIDGSVTGRAVNLEGGNDTLNIAGGSASILGDVDGGAGSDTLNFTPGAGNTFEASSVFRNFETINVHAGTIILSTSLAGNGNGTTHVKNGGELNIASTGDAGDVTVEAGGRLSGDGLGGLITLEAGAVLAPGNSPGTLEAESLTWEAGAKLVFELGATSDKLILGALLNGGGIGNFEFIFSDAGGLALTTYELITFDSTDFDPGDFSFSSAFPGFDGEFTLGPSSLSFTVHAVPEPSSSALVGLALLTWMAHRAPRRRVP